VAHKLLFAAAALIAGMSTPAAASPPPLPPTYVMDVAHLLTGKGDTGTIPKLSNFIADDVRAYVNDELVAGGKRAWMRYWTHSRASGGRVLGYSPDWRDNGALMIVDEYDTVDRSNLPPNCLADPRMTSRATLYMFGPDHKIHSIRTILGGGFWIKP
jgi:hypothetical protein